MSDELKALEKKFKKDLSKIYNIYPVPIGDICDILEIELHFDKNMDDKTHGNIKYENNKFIININDKHSAYNNIFTIAHEIGHYLKHTDQVIKNGFVDRIKNIKETTVSEDIRKMEREANNFAANLLMPKDKFTEVFIETNGNLETLEAFFKVSIEAIKYRALNLGLILA
jgi:Zn-dependent peptidase ImmA (M78 family)